MKDAVVAVLRRADRVLVIRRGPIAREPDYWGPLTGTIEPGESQQEALVREVKEEVGLKVTPLTKVWLIGPHPTRVAHFSRLEFQLV